jgi:hypothetical protein
MVQVIAALSRAGMLSIRVVLDSLDLNQEYTARRMHFDDAARPLAVQCPADGAYRGNAVVSNVGVARPGEHIDIAITGLDITNVDAGSEADDLFFVGME